MPVTPAEFRRIALALPEAVEVGHMRHPDFRVAGWKDFATLGHPDAAFGMVKLLPDQQEAVIRSDTKAFSPVAGAWGSGGATRVALRFAKKGNLRKALALAWRNASPK
jgi:hypothetical protein